MHLAINTGSLSFDTREAIAQVHGLGFSAVEVNLQQAEFAYGFTRTPNLAFYTDLAREIALRKLIVTDIHALFLDTAQMFSARSRREVLAAEGQVARMLDSDILVVHPADVLDSEEWFDLYAGDLNMQLPLVDEIGPVIRELQSGGVQIAFENVQYWQDARGTNDAEVMARLVEALDCHVALDVRRGSDRPSLERWLELLGDRIAVLHLHDSVDGIEHHPPAAPDWKQSISQLKRTSARACVIESSANRNPGAIKVSREYIWKLLQAE
jgi:sugar phosphate isomerase/epimerase